MKLESARPPFFQMREAEPGAEDEEDAEHIDPTERAVRAALGRGLSSQLSLDADWEAEQLQEPQTVRIKEEVKRSRKFGVMTKYTHHHMTLRLRNPSAPECGCIGLPEGTAFSTLEQMRLGPPRSFYWVWKPVCQFDQEQVPAPPDLS